MNGAKTKKGRTEATAASSAALADEAVAVGAVAEVRGNAPAVEAGSTSSGPTTAATGEKKVKSSGSAASKSADTSKDEMRYTTEIAKTGRALCRR